MRRRSDSLRQLKPTEFLGTPSDLDYFDRECADRYLDELKKNGYIRLNPLQIRDYHEIQWHHMAPAKRAKLQKLQFETADRVRRFFKSKKI